LKRIVYVHSDAVGIPYSNGAYDAWAGFKELGYDVRLYTLDTMDSLPLAHGMIVVGGIPQIQRALARIGAPPPPELNVPEILDKMSFSLLHEEYRQYGRTVQRKGASMAQRTQKSEIIERLAQQMETDEETAARWLDGVTETLYEAIKAGESVTLPGFGSFFVRPESATWVFKFNPAQRLRAALGWSSTYKGSR